MLGYVGMFHAYGTIVLPGSPTATSAVLSMAALARIAGRLPSWWLLLADHVDINWFAREKPSKLFKVGRFCHGTAVFLDMFSLDLFDDPQNLGDNTRKNWAMNRFFQENGPSAATKLWGRRWLIRRWLASTPPLFRGMMTCGWKSAAAGGAYYIFVCV